MSDPVSAKCVRRYTKVLVKTIHEGSTINDAISHLCGYTAATMIKELDMSPDEIGLAMRDLAQKILYLANAANQETH